MRPIEHHLRRSILVSALLVGLAACSPPPLAGDPGPTSDPARSYVVGSLVPEFGPDGAQQWLCDLPGSTRGQAVAVNASGERLRRWIDRRYLRYQPRGPVPGAFLVKVEGFDSAVLASILSRWWVRL